MSSVGEGFWLIPPPCCQKHIESITHQTYYEIRRTHVEHLLDVELVVDPVSQDVLVLPYEGDVGVGQVHPWFLQGRGGTGLRTGRVEEGLDNDAGRSQRAKGENGGCSRCTTHVTHAASTPGPLTSG